MSTTQKASAHRKRTQWLLDFLRRDMKALSPGELLDLRLEVYRFAVGVPLRASLDGDPHWPADDEDYSARDILGRLQSSIASGIEALQDGRRWLPFGLAARELADYKRRYGHTLKVSDSMAPKTRPVWIVEPCDDGTIRRCYSAGIDTSFLLAAVDLLIQSWPQLRNCKHGGCGVLFLPRHGRQRYHQPACSNRARQAKHAPKQKRDYAVEYKKRRNLGPNVRVQGRTKRKKGGGKR